MKLIETLYKDTMSYVKTYAITENHHENHYFLDGVLVSTKSFFDTPIEYAIEDGRKWCEGLVLLQG